MFSNIHSYLLSTNYMAVLGTQKHKTIMVLLSQSIYFCEGVRQSTESHPNASNITMRRRVKEKCSRSE